MRSGPRAPDRNPLASAAASSEPTTATSIVSAEPALPLPKTSRSPIAVAAPTAVQAAPAVTASVLASTMCRGSTTCGNAAESAASMNLLTPATASAPT